MNLFLNWRDICKIFHARKFNLRQPGICILNLSVSLETNTKPIFKNSWIVNYGGHTFRENLAEDFREQSSFREHFLKNIFPHHVFVNDRCNDFVELLNRPSSSRWKSESSPKIDFGKPILRVNISGRIFQIGKMFSENVNKRKHFRAQQKSER